MHKTLFRTLIVSLIVAVAAGLLAVPAFAQDDPAVGPYTVELTEDQINDSFRVNNPRRARISDLSVDLQDDAAVVTATANFRNDESVVITTTYVPSIENSRIFWTVTAVATDGGFEASDEQIEQINNLIAASWRTYIKKQYPGRVVALDIDNDMLTLTYNARREFTRPNAN